MSYRVGMTQYAGDDDDDDASYQVGGTQSARGDVSYKFGMTHDDDDDDVSHQAGMT